MVLTSIVFLPTLAHKLEFLINEAVFFEEFDDDKFLPQTQSAIPGTFFTRFRPFYNYQSTEFIFAIPYIFWQSCAIGITSFA